MFFDSTATPRYDYIIRDHLGNTRVVFSDLNGDEVVDSTEILSQHHYYAFGMEMEGEWNAPQEEPYRYSYNGKELNRELDLNWLSYGAREYDPSIGRWLQIDPLAEKYQSLSPYNYTLNNPIIFTDPNGMNVIVGSEERNGKQHITITYNGVLIDKTSSSQEELTVIRDQIISQLSSSFTGENENLSWSINVNLRIGDKALGEGEERESTIQLVYDETGSSTHLNGFDAIVAKNTFTGDIGATAAHEVGHTMGLPHVFESFVEGASSLIPVATDLITSDNPLNGNLMVPGPFPARLRGTKVLGSQAQHIYEDYEADRLNKENKSGSDTNWGDLKSDNPVYKFEYFPIIKSQLLRQKR